MAAPINNIAATFGTVPVSSSSSSSSSSPVLPSSLNPGTLSLSSPPQPRISASWNPHSVLPRSRRSSLLNLYGGPGPSPLQAIPSFRGNFHQMIQVQENPSKSKSISVSIGDKIPNATLSYLDRNNHLRSITVSAIAAKVKKLVLLGVSVPFAPQCSRFVQMAEEIKSRNVDAVACVAMNDVFVMKAWGEHLSLDLGDKLMMLSDGNGELCRALGLSLDLSCCSSRDGASLGLGNRLSRFCLVAVNGVIRSIRVDDSDGFISGNVVGAL